MEDVETNHDYATTERKATTLQRDRVRCDVLTKLKMEDSTQGPFSFELDFETRGPLLLLFSLVCNYTNKTPLPEVL